MLFINCVVHMDTKGKKAFNICMDFRGSGVSYFYFFCFLIAQIHHVASNLVFLPMLHEVNDTFHDAGHRRDSNMIMTIHGHPVHVGKRLRLFISGMHFYFLRKSYGSDSRLFFFFFFLPYARLFRLSTLSSRVCYYYLYHPGHAFLDCFLRSMAWAVSGSCCMYISRDYIRGC